MTLSEVTMMRPRSLGLMLAAMMMAALTAVDLCAKELQPVTGREWTTATEREKKAFLYGLGTMIQLEHDLAVQQNLSPNRQSLIPTFVRGLQGTNLVQVMRFVDSFYAQNPSRQNQPVVDVIWHGIVLPGVQQAQAITQER